MERKGKVWQVRQSMARFVLFRIGEERLVKSGCSKVRRGMAGKEWSERSGSNGQVSFGMAGMARCVVLRQA